MRGDPFCTSEKCQKKFRQNRLTHLYVAMVNRLGNSSSHQKLHDRLSDADPDFGT